jgi:hypothetical protein
MADQQMPPSLLKAIILGVLGKYSGMSWVSADMHVTGIG